MADEIKLGADFSKVESEARDASKALDQISESSKEVRDFLQEVEDDAKASMAEVAKSTDKAKASTDGLGEGVTGLGGKIAELSQGGLPGLVGGLEELATSVVGSGGLAIGLAALTIAFEALRPAAVELWRSFVDGSNKIPPLADDLANLKERLGEVEGQLKTLREKQSLTNQELADYNKLVGEQVEAERAVNVERERRKALDEEAAGSVQPGASEAAKKAIQSGGGFDVVSNEASNALDSADPEIAKLRSKIVDLNKALTKGFAEVPDFQGKVITDQIDEAQRTIDSRSGGNRTQANDLLGKARQGDTAAINQLAALLPSGGFNAATPEGLKSAKESEAAARRDADYGKARDKAIDDAAKARDKEREADAAAEQKAAIDATNKAYAQRAENEKAAQKAAEAAEKERAKGDVRSARALEKSMNQKLPPAPKPLDDQLIMNQQMLADQMNRQMMWQQQQMMAAQYVPSLLQYGGL